MLDPFVTAQFLGVISSTLNGEAVVKGRSLFRDRLGEQVASPLVTMIDDPTNPKAYTATDVDGEGLAARRNVLIEDGVLRQFVHNSYSARRAGTVSTGNAIRGGFAGTPGVGCLALSLVPGTRQQEELIADIDDGLLVQQMQGLHSGVNPISGDFSTGAAGLLITNGDGRCTGARVHHRIDVAAHAARHRRGRWRPRLAADAGGRDEPRDQRRHDVRSLRALHVPTVPSAAAVGRHPHLATPVAAGRVRVDLHSHTMWSGDSTTMPEELATSIVESGIDVLCITDHNAIAGAVELADRLPCRVVVGEELRTAAGEIIGLFLVERVPSGIGHIEAARAIREQGGLVYIPHPFDPMRRNLTEAALYELAELGSDRRDRGAQLQDVAGEPEPPGGRVRRRVRSRRRRGQRRPRPGRDRLRVRGDRRLHHSGRVPRRTARRRRRRPPLGRTAPVVGAHRAVRLTFS